MFRVAFDIAETRRISGFLRAVDSFEKLVGLLESETALLHNALFHGFNCGFGPIGHGEFFHDVAHMCFYCFQSQT